MFVVAAVLFALAALGGIILAALHLTTKSAPIPLAVGDNTVMVLVTAEFGSPTKLYTVTVNRAPLAPVSNTNDSGPGSLRDALAMAQDGDTINFTISVGAPGASGAAQDPKAR